jgi:DNA-3-methyladenine glycosylase II
LNPLDEHSLLLGVTHLIQTDSDLTLVVEKYGYPPLWARQPGFPTLVHIILEQQVSLASARAAFDRLCRAADPLTPERFLEFDSNELLEIGFSRQKAGYCRGLSAAILAGEIDLDELENLDDETARARLMGIKGVGPWTADIYLLMALRRPDIWPAIDLVLISAAQSLKGLDRRPDREALEQMAESWRPWRAVAARLLWHYYLSALRKT